MKTSSPGDHYKIELLSSKHDRGSFRCGESDLDRYLQHQALQDVKRKFASVFVAVELTSGVVHGFYSLSMARKMPRYPTVPAVRLGRLAVHLDFQGIGLGTHLLIDAMNRVLKNEIAWTSFIVDVKSDKVRDWYTTSFGFQSFLDNKNHLYLMRKTIESALK
jgi:ribosomal protein S18 acetylase RimI-like enzyme